MSPKDDGRHLAIRDSVFRFVENDDSGTIDAREFAVLYDAIKKDLEEDLEKQAALEKEASSATRRFKMLLLFVAVLVSFLAASVAANFAVLFTFVDAAITTATTGSGMLEVKGSDTIIKTAIATQDVPLMAAPALDIDTLSEVKSLKVVYSSTLGERIEAQLTVVGVRKHNSTFVEFVTSVGGETVEALNGIASLVRYPTNANRLTTPIKHAICSANATCSAFRTRGIDVGAALDLARAQLEKSGFQNAARRLSPTLMEYHCFFGWWTWSACNVFGGLACPWGSVWNAMAYYFTGYSWFGTRHVVFFAHGWKANGAHMWMLYCTFGVMWCPVLEMNEFRHLVFVFPTSFINGYLEASAETHGLGGWGLAWNNPLDDSLKFEQGTDALAALMCGNTNAFELEWCWGFGWLAVFGVDDSSEAMIIGFSNGAGVAAYANWAYGTTVTKAVAIDYHASADTATWLPAVHASSSAAGLNLKMYEACASWTFSTDGIFANTPSEMTFGSGGNTLNDDCSLGVTSGGTSLGFDPLCYRSYGGFGYGYLTYKQFSWSETAPGTRKLVWAVHGYDASNECTANLMAAGGSASDVHMFVPYFVGIVHDVLEWVDASTSGSWSYYGGSGAAALPPHPPAPPSPYPPPFPPTSSWFLGIKPLKPIVKPGDERPGDDKPTGNAFVWDADAKKVVQRETTFDQVFQSSFGLNTMSKVDEYVPLDNIESSRQSLERVKQFCVDSSDFAKKEERRRLKGAKKNLLLHDVEAKLHDDAKLHEDPSGVTSKWFFEPPSGSVDDEYFEDLPFAQEGFEAILHLPHFYREKLNAEYRGEQLNWDFHKEEEMKRMVYEAKFFKENEYGVKESILRQRDLNISMDDAFFEKYDNAGFAAEEFASIYGPGAVLSKTGMLNVLGLSTKAPTAIYELEMEKQNLVRESYAKAMELANKKRESGYTAPPPPPALEEATLEEEQPRLIEAGFAEEELAALAEDGIIVLCDNEDRLPPNQTDALTAALTPPEMHELAKALTLQFGDREGFELFNPRKSGLYYPVMECKYEHGCFDDSDYQAQKEFMKQQDEDLDGLRNEADFGFSAPIKSMNNLKKYLDLTFDASPVESVMKILGTPSCFSRTTTACRLLQPASAGDALAACFGGGLDAVAERVSMGALVAGDTVLADGAALTRVVVNQHAGVKAAAPMLTLHFEGGSLSLTADHVLLLDGALAPARLAAVGSVLSSGRKVSAITHGTQDVVNPITAAGTILAAGPSGDPVVAATANEWLADVLFSAYPKYTLSFTLAALFPASVQAYYDSALEPFFSLLVPRLEHVKSAAPMPAVAAGLVLGDTLLAGGLLSFCIGKLAIFAAAAAAFRVSRKA